MRAKTFAMVKEGLAVGRHAAEVGGAQVAEVYQIDHYRGGRGLTGEEAHHLAAQVRMGKCTLAFRIGNDPKERANAIEDLFSTVKGATMRGGSQRFRFNQDWARCVAAVAMDELTIGMCITCRGAGQVRNHDQQKLEGKQPMKVCPSCSGERKRRYSEDERVKSLARSYVLQQRLYTSEEEREALHHAFIAERTMPSRLVGILAQIANDLRADRKLDDFNRAIDFAKGEVLASERLAVESVAVMLERL